MGATYTRSRSRGAQCTIDTYPRGQRRKAALLEPFSGTLFILTTNVTIYLARH